MRKEFIREFIFALGEFATGFVGAFRRESMHYKDLRIGGFDPERIYKGFRNLEGRNIIRRINSEQFEFTQKGRTWLTGARIKYFQKRYPKWDGKWRVVLFDIPQELHKKRIMFRRKLQQLGFTPLQKSVLVLPYPCQEEIGDICGMLEISEYVDFIVAEKIGFRQEEIEKMYGI